MIPAPYRADDVDRVEPVDPAELAHEVELYERHLAHQEALTASKLQRQLKAALGDEVTITAPRTLRMRRNH